MHPIPEKGKIQPYPNSPDEDEHLAFTAVNTQNELEYRWTHVSIVVTGLRWWNTVSVYHRLWLPSASSPMGLPRIRHIRRSSCWIVEEVLEDILSGSGYWRTLPSFELSLLFRSEKVEYWRISSLFFEKSRYTIHGLLFRTGWHGPFIPRLWSTEVVV